MKGVTLSVISIILILIISALAGACSVLDQFQFHQPLVACTLVGFALGNPTQGIILGGSLQLLALGWMNIGAAVAPDAATASVISAILVCGPAAKTPYEGIAYAVLLSVAGLALTVFARTLAVPMMHLMDKFANEDNPDAVSFMNIATVSVHAIRVAAVAGIVCAINADALKAALDSIPVWLSGGLSVAGGFVVVVGYAMVVNMMATPEMWPFFFIGFAFASLTELNLIALGIIGVAIALVYINLSPKFNGSQNVSVAGGSDELDDLLNDF
jgi:PTS system mannose-specific IIC component